MKDDNWTYRFKGVEFQSNEITEEIFKFLIADLPLTYSKSNNRSSSTLPTWHVFYGGVRILAVDVNKFSLYCRFLKPQYMPPKFFKLGNLRKEKTGVYNITLEDSFDSEQISSLLKDHIQIIDNSINQIESNLTSPIKDKDRLKEQYFEDLIIKELPNLYPSLNLVRRQAVIPNGRIDLLYKDNNNNPVVIELKIGKGTLDVVKQITNYIEYIKKITCRSVRGIIIIQNDNNYLAKLCIKNNLELLVWDKIK